MTGLANATRPLDQVLRTKDGAPHDLGQLVEAAEFSIQRCPKGSCMTAMRP